MKPKKNSHALSPNSPWSTTNHEAPGTDARTLNPNGTASPKAIIAAHNNQ